MSIHPFQEASLSHSIPIPPVPGQFSRNCITRLLTTPTYIIAALDDHTVHVFSPTGSLLHILNQHTGAIWSLALVNDTLLASGSTDQTIKLWDLHTGRCVRTLEGHTGTVRSLLLAANGSLVSGARDGTVRVWDTESGECRFVLRGHAMTIREMAVEENLVVSGSYDRTARLWDVSTGERLQTFVGHKEKIYSVLMKGGKVVTGSMDCTIRVWDMETGFVVFFVWICEQCTDCLMIRACLGVLEGHWSLVSRLTLHNDILVSGGADELVLVWSMKEMALVHEIRPDQGAVVSMSYSDPWIVTASNGGKLEKAIKIWDRRTGNMVREFASRTNVTDDVVWHVEFGDDKMISALTRHNKPLIEVSHICSYSLSVLNSARSGICPELLSIVDFIYFRRVFPGGDSKREPRLLFYFAISLPCPFLSPRSSSTQVQVIILSPLSKQGHDTSTCENTNNHESQSLVVSGPVGVEKKVSGQELNQAVIDKDAGADRVKDTLNDVLPKDQRP